VPARERCRLYLVATPADPPAFLADLLAALDGGDVASVELAMIHAAPEAVAAACKVLAPPVRERGVAFLVRDHPEIADAQKLDGVYLKRRRAEMAAVRARLGGDRIVGVYAGCSRHRAMEAGEMGADFVAFGPLFGLEGHGTRILAWWDALMVVPSVARGGIDLETAPRAVRAGADFLAVGQAVWRHPEGPREAVRRFNDVVDRSQASC
jgi:thiamine-phosphate pyrophosphorylase